MLFNVGSECDDFGLQRINFVCHSFDGLFKRLGNYRHSGILMFRRCRKWRGLLLRWRNSVWWLGGTARLAECPSACRHRGCSLAKPTNGVPCVLVGASRLIESGFSLSATVSDKLKTATKIQSDFFFCFSFAPPHHHPTTFLTYSEGKVV